MFKRKDSRACYEHYTKFQECLTIVYIKISAINKNHYERRLGGSINTQDLARIIGSKQTVSETG